MQVLVNGRDLLKKRDSSVEKGFQLVFIFKGNKEEDSGDFVCVNRIFGNAKEKF